MNIHFQELVSQHFNDDSKVWIYQSNRQFTINETVQIEELLADFTSLWKSHGADVKGFGKVFFGQFIIIMADETATGVSGCSTDGSVRLIKNIELDYNISLFDRQTLAFIIDERIRLFPLKQLNVAIENELIAGDTLYFDNTVQTKSALMENWIVPVRNSWLSKKIVSFS